MRTFITRHHARRRSHPTSAQSTPDSPPRTSARQLNGLVVLLFLWMASASIINAQTTADRMLLHSSSVTTDSVARRLTSQGATVLHSSPFYRVVTIRVDSATETAVLRNPWVLALEPVPTLATSNDKSRTAIGVDMLLASPYAGTANIFNLSGQNVRVGIWDAMFPDAHTDFGPAGRLTVVENQSCPGSGNAGLNHATHVTGTVGGTGAGSTPQYRYAGMAPKASLFSWSMYGPNCGSGPPYPFDEALSAASPVTQSIVIAQNSWGFGITSASCGLHGAYPIYANAYDRLVRDANLSVFFAAGNQRGNAPLLSACGLASGFGTLTPPATAKNVISVGAVDHLGVMTSFSSWGPARDGRLKPDCVADGLQVFSSVQTSSYAAMSGTSMASPAASGSGALLIERYRQKNSSATPRPDVLKNIMLNTCRDLGNPGPDYRYGYGMLDIPAAARMIDDNRIRTGVISSTKESQQFEFTVPTPASGATCPIRVMLVYSDAPGNPQSATALVNDLDLVLIDPAGNQVLPLTLNPATPATNAVAAANHRDNVEQVVVQAPAPGTWTIRVTGFAINPAEGSQPFSVTWSEPCSIELGECIDFEDEDISNWDTYYADKSVAKTGDPYGTSLILRDKSSPAGTGGSFGVNNSDFRGNWLEIAQDGCLCFDYKVDWQGSSNSATSVPHFTIYTGTAITNYTGLVNSTRATFRGASGNPPIEDDVWRSFCLPIDSCTGGQLPSNSYGTWSIHDNTGELTGQAACDAWNDIITDVTGVVLSTEYNSGTEDVYFDNFCWTCAEQPCAEVVEQEISCRLDEKGKVVYDYCVTIENTSALDAYSSTGWATGPAGVTVTPSADIRSFSWPNPPVPPGGTWTHCFTISGPGAVPGATITFDANINLRDPSLPGDQCVKCETSASVALPECPVPTDCCPADFTKAFENLKLNLSNTGPGAVTGMLGAGPQSMQSVAVSVVGAWVRGVPVAAEITGGVIGGSSGVVDPVHQISFGQWAPCRDLTATTGFNIALLFPPHSCPTLPPGEFTTIACPERDSICLRIRYVDCACRSCDTIICLATTRKRKIIFDFAGGDQNGTAAGTAGTIRGRLLSNTSARVSIAFPQPIDTLAEVTYIGASITPSDARATITGASGGRAKDFFFAAAGTARGVFEAGPGDSLSIALTYDDFGSLTAIRHSVTVVYRINGEILEDEVPVTFYRDGLAGGDIVARDSAGGVSGTRTIVLHLENANHARQLVDRLSLRVSEGVEILAVGPTSEPTSALVDLARVKGRGFVGEEVDGYRIQLRPGERLTPIYVTLRGGGTASSISYTTLDADGNVITDGELAIPSSVSAANGGETTGGSLMEAYPNPTNGTSTIRVLAPKDLRYVDLTVTDAAGNVVGELWRNALIHAGTHLVAFDTSELPSGSYFYILRTELGTESYRLQVIH